MGHKNPLSLHRKCGDLEEELKNVTNNLKSLEAASEKVGGWPVLEGDLPNFVLLFSQGTASMPGYQGSDLRLPIVAFMPGSERKRCPVARSLYLHLL